MTLVLNAIGRDSIWIMADRRLTANGKVVRDDARKIVALETPDAIALCGYAGLGATAKGTEPADWMCGVLRDKKRTLEQSLRELGAAMESELPKHIGDSFAHVFATSANVNGDPRLYGLQLNLGELKLWRLLIPGTEHTERVAMAGSGVSCLFSNRRTWARQLMRTISAHERGLVSPRVVAQEMAKLNAKVAAVEPTVGPRCVVAWRYREGARVSNGGGRHACFDGTDLVDNDTDIPVIANGYDPKVLFEVMGPHMRETFAAMRRGETPPEMDRDAITRELARLHVADKKLK